jgi:pyruvate dehydrogenase E2 component (dihydrolipoamide acetyltransferase)
MYDFKMPKLGADMDEGTLLEWKISTGDHVRAGDVVAVIETAKGAIDVESFTEGVVASLLVKPNTSVAVGTVIARFRATDEAATDPQYKTRFGKAAQIDHKNKPSNSIDLAFDKTAIEAASAEATANTPASEHASQQFTSTSAHLAPAMRPITTGLLVSPRARRLAAQLNVDLKSVPGTGPGGSIVAEDVQRVARDRAPDKMPAREAAQECTADQRQSKHDAMRSAIAAAMSRSKREIPHYYLTQEIDVTALLELVESRNRELAVEKRLLPAVMYYKAVAIAAAQFESLNGHYEIPESESKRNRPPSELKTGIYRPSPVVNLSIAISLRGGGLVAPCLMNAAVQSAEQLMVRLRDLVRRARQGGLRASELSAGTLTVSNLGDRGVDSLLGVIYPPQVALVGIGTARQRPWIVDGKVAARWIVTFSLAADHRVSDGHIGALFLRRIEEFILNPEELWLGAN